MVEQKRSTAKRTPVPNVPPSAKRSALDTEPSAPSADSANLALFHEKLYDLSLASLSRLRSAAVALQVVSALAGVLYAAVLAYALTSGVPVPPLRAIVAPVFLALGLCLAGLSIGTTRRMPDGVAEVGASGSAEARATTRLSFFTGHVERLAGSSGWLVRSAAVAVAVGVAALALPFLPDGTPAPAADVADVQAVPTATRTVDWPEQPEAASKVTEETYYKVELYRAQLTEAMAEADREYAAEQAALAADAASERAEAAAIPPAPGELDGIPFLARVLGIGLVLVAIPGVVEAIVRVRRSTRARG